MQLLALVAVSRRRTTTTTAAAFRVRTMTTTTTKTAIPRSLLRLQQEYGQSHPSPIAAGGIRNNPVLALAATPSLGTEQDSIQPPPQQQQTRSQQQTQSQAQYPRAAVAVAVRCLCYKHSRNEHEHEHDHQQQPEPHYLLIRRGNEPNKGKWALPGGKLEWGETTLEGAKRELAEETQFLEATKHSNNTTATSNNDWELAWSPHPYTATDSIVDTRFHYLIALCFAELQWTGNDNATANDNNNDNNNGTNHNENDSTTTDSDGSTTRTRSSSIGELFLLPPGVTAADDATDARWWSMNEIETMDQQEEKEGNDNNNIVNNSNSSSATTPGFVERMKRTEFLYQKGVLY